MASRDKKGGDFVLESRHVVGLFLLLVVIFGVVFTLGYLLGRSQYDTKLRAFVGIPPGADAVGDQPAAKTKPRPEAEDTPAAQNHSEWEFFRAAEPQGSEDHLEPASKPVATAAEPPDPRPPSPPVKPARAGRASGAADGSPTSKGSIMLQVAAVRHQGDAQALAQALQQKKFPATVLSPGADKFYRVQVGPYRDNQSAAKARSDLQAQGFKSIIKR